MDWGNQHNSRNMTLNSGMGMLQSVACASSRQNSCATNIHTINTNTKNMNNVKTNTDPNANTNPNTNANPNNNTNNTTATNNKAVRTKTK